MLKIGVIGGSGIGAAMSDEPSVARHEVSTPFGPPSDLILETNWFGTPTFLLSRHGPGHLLNPSRVNYRANIFALKKLGCTHIIATGAVGSLRDEFTPRQLVIPDQIIDKTLNREATFFDDAAVHVELAEPFCPVLRKHLIDTGSREQTKVHSRGCYVAMEGPAFSSRAESIMHRLWGGDVIGMTAMPEARLAREAEIAYALIALVTDFDSWRQKDADSKSDPSALLADIVTNLAAASAAANSLIKNTVEHLSKLPVEEIASPAHDALRLAIWSDKNKIPREQADRLAVIWGHHFR